MNKDFMSTCHSKCYFKISFRQLIMNIDCEKVTEHMDNSEDDYRGYIQNVMIM